MSVVVSCDFCGKELQQGYPRPGIEVKDEDGFVSADYDVCNPCASLVVQMLEQRKGMLYEEGTQA